MAKNRKTYDSQFKFNVVLELLKWRKTQAEIASEYWVHPSQQNRRKDEFMKAAPEIFTDKRRKENETDKQRIAQLERKVGQYAMEVDWLQKKIGEIPFL